MALNVKHVNAFYLAMFNRVPEGSGQQHWLNTAIANGWNGAQLGNAMLQSSAAQEYFQGYNDSRAFVTHIYENLLNKTYAEDPDGINAWAGLIDRGMSKGEVVSKLLWAAENGVWTDERTVKAQNTFLNKLKAASFVSSLIQDVPNGGDIQSQISAFVEIARHIDDQSTAIDLMYWTYHYAKTTPGINIREVSAGLEQMERLYDNITLDGGDIEAMGYRAEEDWGNIRVIETLRARSPKMKDYGFNYGNVNRPGTVTTDDVTGTMPREENQHREESRPQAPLIHTVSVLDSDKYYKPNANVDAKVKYEGINSLYKGDNGKFYSDAGGTREVNLATAKATDVKIGNDFAFKIAVPRTLDTSNLTKEGVVATAKNADVLNTQNYSAIFDARGNIKELIGTADNVIGAKFLNAIGGATLANDIKFRVLDSSENLQRDGIMQSLNSFNNKIFSIDVKNSPSNIELNADQYRTLSSKFTDASDVTGAIRSFPSLRDKIATVENIILKDTATNVKALNMDILRSVSKIDLTQRDDVINFTPSQYREVASKFKDANDTIKVLNASGSLRASDVKDIFNISSDANDFDISSFGSSDKINFSRFGLTTKTEVTATANTQIADKALYMVRLNENIANKDFSGAEFNELFTEGRNNKAFSTETSSSLKAIIGVKGNDTVQFYKLNANDDGNVTSDELSLLGNVTMAGNATFNGGNVEIA